MKSFSDFIKEEIDLRGNNIPDNLMGDSDRQASANLGISIDNPAQMRTYGPQIMNLIGQSSKLAH
jgi:hypothetical protein